jgi:hypothetical protein
MACRPLLPPIYPLRRRCRTNARCVLLAWWWRIPPPLPPLHAAAVAAQPVAGQVRREPHKAPTHSRTKRRIMYVEGGAHALVTRSSLLSVVVYDRATRLPLLPPLPCCAARAAPAVQAVEAVAAAPLSPPPLTAPPPAPARRRAALHHPLRCGRRRH